MSTLSLRLPNSLHDRLRELAEAEGVSMNQFISTAVAEKIAALMTREYLKERAARGSRAKFEKALKQIPDVDASEEDSL
ncbi:MAG: toxin-antitoxin system HicB family antitoxin [Rhodothermales bacterium]|nr:toxin-antitoxin system HicB family antitoxin [Rhodothermales bacterium]